MRLLLCLTALCAAVTLTVAYVSPVFAADEKPVVLTGSTADEWTALFDRRTVTRTGWLGADGIFCVSLDGDDSFASADGNTTTMFIFSDTLTGTSDKKGKIYRMRMPNHSAAVLQGDAPDPDKITFVTGRGGNGNTEQNLFTDRRLWLLDCFVTGGSAHVFAFPPTDDWKPKQTELYRIPIENGTAKFENFVDMGVIPQLYYRDDRYIYDFGMAVTCNTEAARAPLPDGYIYIYGYRDAVKEYSRKDLIAARIKESDFPDFSKLQYYTGSGWGDNIEDCAVLISWVSCEMSVTPVEKGPYRGKYIAVYTKYTEGNEITYAIGDSPVGPFADPVCFYQAPEHGTTGDDGVSTRYTYNAKAHPHLSDGTKLLVSYNVNIRNGTQYTTDYHPRFLWLDLDPEHTGDADVPGIVNYDDVPKPTVEPVETVEPAKPSGGGNTGTAVAVAACAVAAAAAIVGAVVYYNKKKNRS